MAVEVRIPTVLQKAVSGVKVIKVEGRTVGELIANIGELHPAFCNSITAASGELHRFVNIYLNDEDIRFLGLLDTPVSEGDVISILPALAGGC